MVSIIGCGQGRGWRSEKEHGKVLISAGIMHDQIFNVSTQFLVFFFLAGSPATTGRKSLAYT